MCLTVCKEIQKKNRKYACKHFQAPNIIPINILAVNHVALIPNLLIRFADKDQKLPHFCSKNLRIPWHPCDFFGNNLPKVIAIIQVSSEKVDTLLKRNPFLYRTVRDLPWFSFLCI